MDSLQARQSCYRRVQGHRRGDCSDVGASGAQVMPTTASDARRRGGDAATSRIG